MKVQIFLAVVIAQWLGDVTAQFTAPPPTCPGDAFTFTCNVTGDSSGLTLWRVCGSSECTLLHSTARALGPCGSGSPFTVTTGTGFGTSATSFSSKLDGIADLILNGTLVECFGPAFSRDSENRVGYSTLQIIGAPMIKNFNHTLSELVNGAVNVTVSWTLSGGESADFYLINITTNAPQIPYGGLLNISVTQHELTGFMAGFEYNITVRGVYCGGQKGRESEPLTIRPQVPDVPADCYCTALYSQPSGVLLLINSSWGTVPDPLDPCPGVTGNITQYRISFQTGSVVATRNVTIARCTAGRCGYNFEPPKNLLLNYDSVSVAAENVLGMGFAKTCTTQTINTTNNLLTGEVVDVSSPSTATFNCTFLSGFTGSAGCTVQYGTDPTYMNLPYSAESTETGTAGDTVSVVLRERLNSSTVYYYTVSAVSGDVTVRVQGNFQTPNELNTTTNERLCVLWSGNYIACECRLPSQNIALIVLGNIALVVTLMSTTIEGIIVGCIHLNKMNHWTSCSKIREDVKDHWMNRFWLALLVVASIFCVIGVALWINVGVMVPNPPNGNACVPSWLSTRDGLIGSAFGASIVAYISLAAAVWVHVYYHIVDIKQPNKKSSIFILLVVAFFLTPIGVGIWIASAVLVHIHCKFDGSQTDGSNTDCVKKRISQTKMDGRTTTDIVTIEHYKNF